jgi:hypothetical integral membrane protein (TIGR02206 family)
MERYFAYYYDGPEFELFGAGHWLSMGIIAAAVAWLILGWRDPGEQSRRNVRFLFAGIMLLNEVGWHAWNILHGAWSLQEHLPLHACSISIWGSIYILLMRDRRLYEIIFFIGIAGAGAALITPSAGEYGLPHYRAFQTLISHGMVVIAMVYMTVIEGFRPHWSSVWKTMLAINLFMFFVTGINYLVGSNYMYTLQKPATTSPLDAMGPWPWYLFYAEFLAVILFGLLYLPFAIADRRRLYAPRYAHEE